MNQKAMMIMIFLFKMDRKEVKDSDFMSNETSNKAKKVLGLEAFARPQSTPTPRKGWGNRETKIEFDDLDDKVKKEKDYCIIL